MSAPEAPRLIQLEPAPRREIPLEGDVTLVGRQSTCGLVLRGEDVSRTHARLVCVLGLHFLEDLGSTNGTHVADPGMPETRLAHRETRLLLDGSVIRIGKQHRFELRGVPATRTEALARIRDGLQQASDLSSAVPGLSPAERDRYLRVLRECSDRLDDAGPVDLDLATAQSIQELGQTLRGTLPGIQAEGDLPLPDLPDELSAPQAQAVRTVLNAFIRDLGSCFDGEEEGGQ